MSRSSFGGDLTMMSCWYSYVSGGWGWNDRDKWQELTDKTSWWVWPSPLTPPTFVLDAIFS